VSGISASVRSESITASVSGVGVVSANISQSQSVLASTSGGVGPQGPPGPSGASSWSEIIGKPATFPPPVATSSVLGGVKQGSNVTIGVDGTIGVAAPFSGSYSDLTNRPSLGSAAAAATTDFAAASHTHSLSSLTQSSATSGQVVTWSGSAWTASDAATPATIDGNGSGIPSLLLHCDGANGGTAFTDSSANALTVTANGVTTSTAQSKFGGASAYFDNSHLEITDANGSPVEALSLGTGEFTVDFWVYVTGGSEYRNILEFGTASDYPATRFGLTIYPSGILQVENFAALVADTTTFPLNQWVHVAVTRDAANTMRLFRNGTVVGSATVSQSFVANMARIGKQWDGNHVVGWLDELRVVKGESLFTGNFTPPTSAYSGGSPGTTIRQRRGTASSLAGVTLASGQIAFETDSGKLKVGDGVTVYSSLAYVSGSGGSSAWADITGKPTFATVATSGAYADLTGLPALFDGAYASLTGLPTLGTAAASASTDFAAVSHAHGNLSSSGLVDGNTASGQIVVTTTGGALTTAASIASSAVTGLPTAGTGSTNYCAGNDARLSDSREWSASTVTQADAEAGTATTRFAFTPLRVFQAIAAWWAASSAKTKLDGIATGATANSSDATLLARANHTGTQDASTITGLGTLATQSGTFSGTSSGTNTGDQTITLSGDVTGSGTGSFAATLSTTGVAASSYGSASSVATFTVDAKGRLTTAGSTSIAIAASAVTSGTFDPARIPTIAYSSLSGLPTLGTAAAAATGDFAAASHSHAASAITSGTIDVARLPVGTGSTQVAAGNDSRFSDSRSPTAHTHPLSDLSQSGATTDQVPKWNGSAWVPATVSGGGGGSSSASDLVSGTLSDALLSDKARSSLNLYLWSNFR
jgi:hypothetical protein